MSYELVATNNIMPDSRTRGRLEWSPVSEICGEERSLTLPDSTCRIFYSVLDNTWNNAYYKMDAMSKDFFMIWIFAGYLTYSIVIAAYALIFDISDAIGCSVLNFGMLWLGITFLGKQIVRR